MTRCLAARWRYRRVGSSVRRSRHRHICPESCLMLSALACADEKEQMWLDISKDSKYPSPAET
jgi:hypothetical protein